MNNCECCGKPLSAGPEPICYNCALPEGAPGKCYPGNAWHCFTDYCDGSGCTYPGQCEGLTIKESFALYDPGYSESVALLSAAFMEASE